MDDTSFELDLSELGVFGASCAIASLYAQGVIDYSFLLNVLIQVSSVMVGFAAVTTVFPVQTGLETDRHVAAQYLILCLEWHKAISTSATGSAGVDPALRDPNGTVRNL